MEINWSTKVLRSPLRIYIPVLVCMDQKTFIKNNFWYQLVFLFSSFLKSLLWIEGLPGDDITLLFSKVGSYFIVDTRFNFSNICFLKIWKKMINTLLAEYKYLWVLCQLINIYYGCSNDSSDFQNWYETWFGIYLNLTNLYKIRLVELHLFSMQSNLLRSPFGFTGFNHVTVVTN